MVTQSHSIGTTLKMCCLREGISGAALPRLRTTWPEEKHVDPGFTRLGDTTKEEGKRSNVEEGWPRGR